MEWDFSKLKIGSMINVQAYKHNGFLYRQWNGAKVIFQNKRHIVLFLYGTKVTEFNRENNGWKYNENAIWFLPKNSFYNAIVLFKENIGKYYYINMASKPIFEDNTIKFIDYDLDIKCYPGKNLQVVDREEFSQNSKLMNYSDEIKTKIYEEIKNIIEDYNSFSYFFNDEIIDYYLEILLKDKLISKTFYNYALSQEIFSSKPKKAKKVVKNNNNNKTKQHKAKKIQNNPKSHE